MIVITWICGALAVYYLYRWLRRSPDKNPADQAFPWITLLVLAVVGGAAYRPTYEADRAARRAADAVSGLVGERLAYTCGSQLGTFIDRDTDLAFGYVRWGEDGVPEKRSKLRHETCSGLMAFLRSPTLEGEDRMAKIIGVHVVSHEARHMVGEMNEAATECQALQRNADVARALGAPEDVAKELALAYWEEFYPRMGGGYHTPECRQGGRLDENLRSSPWNLRRP